MHAASLFVEPLNTFKQVKQYTWFVIPLRAIYFKRSIVGYTETFCQSTRLTTLNLQSVLCLCVFLFVCVGLFVCACACVRLFFSQQATKIDTPTSAPLHVRQGRSMHHPEDLINAMHTPSLPRVHVEKNKKEFNKTLYDRSFVGGLEIASG